MDNDTVITSAEANSEENAMAMARTEGQRLLREKGGDVRIRRLPGQ
jgi:hypothetical protein